MALWFLTLRVSIKSVKIAFTHLRPQVPMKSCCLHSCIPKDWPAMLCDARMHTLLLIELDEAVASAVEDEANVLFLQSKNTRNGRPLQRNTYCHVKTTKTGGRLQSLKITIVPPKQQKLLWKWGFQISLRNKDSPKPSQGDVSNNPQTEANKRKMTMT